MEQPQQQHREYQWQVEEEADDANLQPRQSRRHRLNNHAATTDIISPSTGNGSSNNSSITDDAGSIQSMTASRAGSATPTFKEEEEIAGNNSISEEVDNEYDHTAASKTCTEFHGAWENGKSTKLDNSIYFDNGQGIYTILPN
jgi:hypothetical protein